jgi:hypothetical protein
MSSKISQDDLKYLLDTLITAIDTGNKQEFIQIMKNQKLNFDMKIDNIFAKGNTLNHSIARAVDDNYCRNNQIDNCHECIGENSKFTIPATPFTSKITIPYGEKPFKILQFILNNEDVKREYKNLFKESYKTIVNGKEKTPDYFADKCNKKDLYNYMNDVNISPENSNNIIGEPPIQDIQHVIIEDNNKINRIKGAEKEDIKTKYGSYVNFTSMGAGKRKHKTRKSRKSSKTRKSRKSKKTRKSKKQRRSHRR